MVKKKFIKKQSIEVNGKMVKVSMFGTSIKPGKKDVLGDIDNLLEEEKLENILQDIFNKIERIALKYPDKNKNLKYYYDVGIMLQFVDERDYADMRGPIWERMAYDFNPELFGGKKTIRSESKRHPEFMYLLGKVPKRNLNKLSWDQWYEVLKFKKIYKKERLLKQIINECKRNDLRGIPLRNRIKEIIHKKNK